MIIPPSLRRLGRVWALFAACGLFGALSTTVFSASVTKDKSEVTTTAAPSQADLIRAQMDARQAAEAPSTILERSTSFFGLFALVGLCWLMSTDRKKINWTLVAWGMALQLIFGVIVLKT
ncbi:MAG: Na+ dependent nucleoside transporter N-terminal domain-containing protein, partial [Elusimicrobiota bacterium]